MLKGQTFHKNLSISYVVMGLGAILTMSVKE
jgi:hypothetical protein